MALSDLKNTRIISKLSDIVDFLIFSIKNPTYLSCAVRSAFLKSKISSNFETLHKQYIRKHTNEPQI